LRLADGWRRLRAVSAVRGTAETAEACRFLPIDRPQPYDNEWARRASCAPAAHARASPGADCVRATSAP
ncbi:MAG: hypothetical protein MPL62_14810, partial [Alphaproteobacteria bacterium]|nr:hypothetical protein [Alphaproteobacteria bacterium]